MAQRLVHAASAAAPTPSPTPGPWPAAPTGPDGAHGASEASTDKRALALVEPQQGIDPWLLQPVLAILVSMLDQRQGRHLLVLE